MGGKDATNAMRPLFKLSPGPLLKSGLGILARYCIHKETISRRPEQVYLLSDQDLNDLERGHYLSETRINAGAKMRLLFKLSHGQLLTSVRQIWQPPGDHKWET